jgi:hypothetical protein
MTEYKLLEYLLAEIDAYVRKVDDQFAPPDKRTPTTRSQLAKARGDIRNAMRWIKARMEEKGGCEK